MKKTVFLCVCLSSMSSAIAVPLTNLNWRLTSHARIEGNLLVVDVPPDKAREGGGGHARVDLSAFSGKCFMAEISARGERISKPRNSWNGLKFMFHYKNPDSGTDQWPNTCSRLGDFPMQTITVSDIQHGRKLGWVDLTLGLQDSSGKVVFDLSTLNVYEQESLYPVTNQDYRVSYPERVRGLPRMRGVMLPSGPCKEDDFRTLREWGATLARYQMTRHFGDIGKDRDLAEYDGWLDGKLDHLERDVLPWAAKYGIMIVVDLHCPPGGRDPDMDWTMYHDAKYADHFVECWRRIARRFKGRPEIYGFDLINEPTQTRRAVCDYWTIQKRAAEAVRALDPDTTIIIESNGWDSSDAFAYLSPLAMDNVIYQVHMYQPHEFTHQGVHRGDDYPRFAYPDEKRGWNIDFIRARLAPVRAFEKKHGAKIYVGEFSAITWAEGAGRYIADCIEVFEEYGWDWTYHAFREWKGWSVEHEVDGHRSKYKPSADNPRRRALLDGLKRGGAHEPKVLYVTQPGLRISGFWAEKLDKLEQAWIPHCWKRLGVRGGAFQRNLAEATMLALERHPERKDLADILERFVKDDIARQQPDGYVGHCNPRYADYGRHELYGQGYFIEAAVRHMEFTKGRDRRYFDAAIRLGDHLDSVFGPPPKRTWTDGHPGVEKALLALADAVDRWDGAGKGAKYAALAHYFVLHQNDIPEYRHAYCQSHEPAVDMKKAEGHAVRGTYFYAGMAGTAWRCGDAALAAAARRVFGNAIDRKGYLTGGVGGQWAGESFGPDWSLPNARAYLEGCAGCGMYDWCTEMARLCGLGRLEDVRERLVYNNLLGTFSKDFACYAYQNPPACANPRYPWHTLPCCVGNVPRVLEDFKNRMYAVSPDGRTLYLNHFIASTGGEATVCGTRVRLELETVYPADGKVALKMSAERPVSFRLRVRQPNRAESKLYTAEPATPHGYRTFEVNLANESTVHFDLPLPLQRVTCDDRVAANRGLVAWQQGPIVYSWEGDGFKTRVPYHMRLNSGGPSRVWLPADGSAPTAETETGDWFRNTGCPLDASNAKVTSSCFLKER